MADFDPDAYLAATATATPDPAPTFDPDQYLAATTPQSGEIAPPEIQPSGYVGKGEFAPSAGAESAPLTSRETPQEQAAQQSSLANAAAVATELASGIPQMAAGVAKAGYEGLKFAALPQERAPILEKAIAEGLQQGRQIAQDVQSPIGTKESFRGLANIGMMAAPALQELLFAKPTSPLAPPVQNQIAPTTAPTLTQTLFGKQESPLVAATNESLSQLEKQVEPPPTTEQQVGAQTTPVLEAQPATTAPLSTTTTGEPSAIQEPSTGAILQRQPQETGATGGERGRVEPGVQGKETPQARQGTEAWTETTQAEVAPPAETPSVPGSATGLTKDFISKDRAERGEAPLSQQARIGNEETWDKAGQKFSANPNVGHELVQQLIDNPRALTQDDLGVLLRHRVNLTNETDFNAEIASNPEAPLPQKAEALQKLAALQDARNQADIVTRGAGSQAGRSMQFLQQLAAQDYTLSSLIQQRRAALGGKPVPPEQLESFTRQTKQYSDDLLAADVAWQNYLKEGKREESALKAYKTRLKGATTEYERRLAFSDFEPAIKRELQVDPEAIQLKANFEKAKDNFQRQLFKDTQASKPLWMKILQGVSYVARESALSGINTLGKLAAFTGAKLGEIPLTETAERVWGKIPGFRELSKTSEFGPGANARQLGEFYKEFFTTGMKEAWQMLTGKGSTTRQALEKEKRFQFPSFFGNLHGVEKTPLLIGSQRMNRMKLMQNEMSKLASESIARGEDISDPLTQGAINYKAFQKATYDILQEQNGFASWVNRGLEQMEAKKKATGEVNATQAVLANLAKTFLTKGIIRVPANYFKQTLERTPLGLSRGVGGAARAWYRGVENVSPAERTAIMKLMGVGSVGSGFFLWGALDALKPPDKRTFGGYYQPREDREKTGDVHFGAIRIGKEIPHLFTHNPMTESAQMGSTLMRVATSLISKKDPRNKGLIEGAIRSVFGLAEQAPISGQAFRLSKIGEPSGPTSVVGEAVRGLIPQLVQNFAQWTDKDTKRKPTTIMESIKMGIPGLRQTVPEGGKKTVNVSRRR